MSRKLDDMTVLSAVLAAVLATSAMAAEPVRIDEGTIAYQVDHRFKSFSGVMSATDAELVLDWDGVDPASFRFEAAIPLVAFDSGNRLRDEHAAETLQVYLYPTARWVVESVEVISPDPHSADATELVLRLSGPLSLNGISNPLEVEIRVLVEDTIQVKGTFAISLEDFGIPRPGLLGFKIADQVQATVDLRIPRPRQP